MRHRLPWLPIALALVLPLCGIANLACAEAPVFFVAPKGNDGWSGQFPDPVNGDADGPFQSLSRARDALRTAPGEGGMVYIREGKYYLEETLLLESADSGTAESPVIWQAYPGEEVRLIGGVCVQDWQPFEGVILQSDLSALDIGNEPISQLYYSGERMTLARWPNKDAGAMPGGNWAFVTAPVPEDRNRSFHYAGDRPSQWANIANAQVSIWPNYNWWQTIADVAKLDPATKTITLKEALPYTIEAGRRFFVRNVREELDAPGEWFYNQETQTLYFWLAKLRLNAVVVAPILNHAIVLQGAQYINLIGFTIEATRNDAIRVKDANNCLIGRCTIRNTGAFGIHVTGGKSVRIAGNDIYDTGRGGVVLAGGDRKTLSPGNHEAINNHIHHFGAEYQTYQTAVNVSGVANRVAHNLIHDAPHIGILLGGNNHIIEYNDIHHVCLEGSDNGAFYMGRDWTQRGNILRYNKFHDIYGFGLAGLGPDADGVYHYESPHQAWGVYLDDCSSGATIYGNLFYRIPLCGVMIGGGRDNTVKNNIFVECVPALHIDDRWDSYCWDIMFERLEAMNYREPPYSQRYPELLDMGEDPRRPENNRFVRNIVSYKSDAFRGLSTTAPHSEKAVVYEFDQFDPVSTVINDNLIFHHGQPIRIAWSVYKQPGDRQTLSWEEWTTKRGDFPLRPFNPLSRHPEDWLRQHFDSGALHVDPQFFRPQDDDYRLQPTSPALKEIAFVPIPVERIGLYQNEFRASWPPPKDSRRDGIEHREWPITIPPES